MTRRAADAALVGNTIIWGATFVMVKSILTDVSPILFLALRFSVAALSVAVLWGPRVWQRGGVTPAGVLVGAFLFSGYLLQTLGLQFTSAAKSAFLTGTTSVLVPLLARLVYRSRPEVFEILGVLTAAAGLGLMTLEGPIGSINRGDLLTIGCAVAFAGHIVTLGHYSEKMSFEELSITQVTTAAVLSGSLFWWVESPHVLWSPKLILVVLITGLLATALAFSVQAWAQRYTTSTRTALIYMLEPVAAWVTSYVVVGEGLSKRATAGAALILGGVLLVELKKPLNPRLHPSQ